MRVNVFDTSEGAARAVAARVQQAVADAPALVLGLPAGHTPLPVYADLKRRCDAGDLDLSRVTTFNLDEFVGVDADHPGSFRHFMDEHLFRDVNVDRARIHFLDGTAPDLEAECRRYDEAIAAAGGIALQILGIGVNGHIGFNEPGDALIAATHCARLQPSTRGANADLFRGDTARVPEFALTMGMGTILSAGEVILIATGERKADCVGEMVHGPLTTRLPASLLQLHANAALYLDRLAAARLA